MKFDVPKLLENTELSDILSLTITPKFHSGFKISSGLGNEQSKLFNVKSS